MGMPREPQGSVLDLIDLDRIDATAQKCDFSGVFSIDSPAGRVTRCYGSAHRAHGIPNTPDTRFGLASGSKAFTALAILRLVEDGALTLDRPVREILGDDLPLIDDGVTIEHLLGHTSGIGDYLDESSDWEPTDYAVEAPVHTLTSAEAFLPLLDGLPQVFPPGDRFAYCNGGYVVLAIALERVSGEGYHDLVDRLVLAPSGLAHTGFPRLDELPADVAAGYLFAEGDRMNTLHLPVRGNGDGGGMLSAPELHAFWTALFGGAIVRSDTLADAIRPRRFDEDEGMHYGLGFWLRGDAVVIEGYDSGVSFRSTHRPSEGATVSVLGNTSEGAWPVVAAVADMLDASTTHSEPQD